MKNWIHNVAIVAFAAGLAQSAHAAVLECTVLSAGQGFGTTSLTIVGQTTVGASGNGSVNAQIGAIHCLAPAADSSLGDCGDFDNDGDVDLSDFSQFSLCFGGANNPPAGSCPLGIDADFDNDGDVDLGDFATFSLCFTGAM